MRLDMRRAVDAGDRRPEGAQYHSPGQGQASSTSQAAALGRDRCLLVGRVVRAEYRRHVAEAEVIRGLIPASAATRWESMSSARPPDARGDYPGWRRWSRRSHRLTPGCGVGPLRGDPGQLPPAVKFVRSDPARMCRCNFGARPNYTPFVGLLGPTLRGAETVGSRVPGGVLGPECQNPEI